MERPVPRVAAQLHAMTAGPVGLGSHEVRGTRTAVVGPLPRPAFRAEIVADKRSTMRAGATLALQVRVKNTSPRFWSALAQDGQGEIMLGNRWLAEDDRVIDDARASLPRDLRPGEELDVLLTVHVPEAPGSYVLDLDMLQERTAWFSELGSHPVRWPVEVRRVDETMPVSAAQCSCIAPRSVCTEPLPDDAFSAWISEVETRSPLRAGSQTLLHVRVKNASSALWPALGDEGGAYQIMLGNRWLTPDGKPSADDGRAPLPRDVRPGEVVELPLLVRAPAKAGSYVLELDLVQENVAWFAGRGSRPGRAAVTVLDPASDVSIIETIILEEAEHPRPRTRTEAPLDPSGFAALVQTMDAPKVLKCGQQVVTPIRVKNISAASWPALGDKDGDYAIQVGNHWLDERGGVVIQDDGRAFFGADLGPGDEAIVDLAVRAPDQPGRYILDVDLLQENVAWFVERGSSPARVHISVDA